MIVVFWLDATLGPAEVPIAHYQAFASKQLGAALAFAEELRARRRQGEALSHVCLQSEMDEAVGLPGVAEPPSDYAHYKRRIDPAIPLGRPSGKQGAAEGGPTGLDTSKRSP